MYRLRVYVTDSDRYSHDIFGLVKVGIERIFAERKISYDVEHEDAEGVIYIIDKSLDLESFIKEVYDRMIARSKLSKKLTCGKRSINLKIKVPSLNDLRKFEVHEIPLIVFELEPVSE